MLEAVPFWSDGTEVRVEVFPAYAGKVGGSNGG
jgi:hypothetical protein